MWFCYNIIFAIGYTLLMPRFIWRMCRRGGYGKGFLQRLGRFDPDVLARLRAGQHVWIHAVSVGEVFVALTYMRTMRTLRPELAFVLSTTTSTGHRVAAARLEARDVLIYFPCDFPWVVRRVLRTVAPRALILTESELWPNLIRQARAQAIPVMLINGRVSATSMRGYSLLRPFVASLLKQMNLLLVQTEADAGRLRRLGADPDRLAVLGTVKYDIAAGAGAARRSDARAWLEAMGIAAATPLIVGGSTWPGEEAVLLDAFERLRAAFTGLRLVLIPRHAERRGDVSREIERRRLTLVARSTGQVSGAASPEGPDVVLVDTTGEAMAFYAVATVIFVGKSLLHHGGQNFIEPAALGKPVVTGPHLENFPIVAREFAEARAFVQVRDAAGLESALRELLGDREGREALAARGLALVRSRQGVVAEGAQRLLRCMREAAP